MTDDLHKHLQLLSEEAASCTRCSLSQHRGKAVFSRGNPEASVVISGINPGEEEAAQGIPFVGRSGKLLDAAIQSLGYDPANDVYIINAVKCHSPNNRQPSSEEIQACYGFLERHLDLAKAKVVITLGGLATHIITDATQGITQLRGKTLKYKERAVIPTFHPSYLARSGNEKSQHYPTFVSDIKTAFQLAKGTTQ